MQPPKHTFESDFFRILAHCALVYFIIYIPLSIVKEAKLLEENNLVIAVIKKQVETFVQYQSVICTDLFFLIWIIFVWEKTPRLM